MWDREQEEPKRWAGGPRQCAKAASEKRDVSLRPISARQQENELLLTLLPASFEPKEVDAGWIVFRPVLRPSSTEFDGAQPDSIRWQGTRRVVRRGSITINCTVLGWGKEIEWLNPLGPRIRNADTDRRHSDRGQLLKASQELSNHVNAICALSGVGWLPSDMDVTAIADIIDKVSNRTRLVRQ